MVVTASRCGGLSLLRSMNLRARSELPFDEDELRARIRNALCCLLLALACQRAPAQAPAVAALEGAPGRSPLVHFEDLKAFLPRAVYGYAPHGDHASIGKYGEVSVSEAERRYLDPQGEELSIRILDTTLLPSLRPALRAAAADALKLSEADPVGPLHLPQSVGFVRYEPDDRTAEVNLLVGDRFVVAIISKGAAGTHAVRRAARGLDLAGLAKLR